MKFKSLLIIGGYSTMILSLPVVAGFVRQVARRDGPGRDADRLVALIVLTFVAATLANVADVTQVAQLGRYYLPVYVLMLPTAVAGLIGWAESRALPRLGAWPGLALAAVLWGGPDVGV